MLKTATVKYKSTPYQDYDFITDIEDLKQGDYVVTDSTNGYNIAQVVEVKQLTNKSKRWVVCKINDEEHKKKIAKANEIKKLRDEMDKRRKQIEETEIYAMLAKKDEEMARLLEEYKTMVSEG